MLQGQIRRYVQREPGATPITPDSLSFIWSSDIKTVLDWAYLAVVPNLCNKEVVGYIVSKNIDTEHVKRALSKVLMQQAISAGTCSIPTEECSTVA